MRLIVVDDDRLVVDSLKIILGAQPQIEVVGTGANGNDAVALYAEHAPDIALLDIQMPGRDGLSAAREILEHDPAARVVFLTTFSDDEYIVSALKLGARGYLIKTDVAAIPPALAQVMDGKRVLEGKAIEDINFDGADVEAGATRRPAAFAGLTDREFEVAELIARGLDNKKIAATAYMGEGTVRNHISSILAKRGYATAPKSPSPICEASRWLPPIRCHFKTMPVYYDEPHISDHGKLRTYKTAGRTLAIFAKMLVWSGISDSS